MPARALATVRWLLAAALVLAAVLTGVGLWFVLTPRGATAPSLVSAGYLLLAAFVLAVVVIYLWRILQLLLADLEALGAMLEKARAAPLVLESPPWHLNDTGTLGQLVQEVAAALHGKESKLAELAQSDAVTGLLNRTHMFQQMRHAFELARRGNAICLMLIEIDNLAKAVDVLGHEAGDGILRMLADILRAQTRRTDLIARLGVHDFAVLYYNADAALMRPRLAHIAAEFAARQQASSDTGRHAYCGLAIGLTAMDPAADARAEDPFLRAQRALRAARESTDGLRIELPGRTGQ